MPVTKHVLKKDSDPFTNISNKVLQSLTNPAALGVYVYLSSMPPNFVFYKECLQKHFGIGRKKLENLLACLRDHKLISLVQIRCAQGKFVHVDLVVHNGEDFVAQGKPIKNKEIGCTPRAKKPLTVNGSAVKTSYKRNIKNKTYIKNKHSCANKNDAVDNLKEGFDLFYSLYPRKRNRDRALEVWVKKKCKYKLDMLLADVQERTKLDVQWQTKRYTPYAARYLSEELWLDEITYAQQTKPLKSEKQHSRYREWKN